MAFDAAKHNKAEKELKTIGVVLLINMILIIYKLTKGA